LSRNIVDRPAMADHNTFTVFHNFPSPYPAHFSHGYRTQRQTHAPHRIVDHPLPQYQEY
jgi:hypothetical protein